jgi:hypothetical protein
MYRYMYRRSSLSYNLIITKSIHVLIPSTSKHFIMLHALQVTNSFMFFHLTQIWPYIYYQRFQLKFYIFATNVRDRLGRLYHITIFLLFHAYTLMKKIRRYDHTVSTPLLRHRFAHWCCSSCFVISSKL